MNVNLCTKECDLDVKYGLYNLGEEREQARTSLKYIFTDITDIKESYFRLGFHLNEFRMCEYYKDFGYLTFEEFCEVNFEMKKGTISRCINVFLMTNSAGEFKYKNGVKTRGCASVMSEKFQDYSYSQLVEMLPLTEEQRKEITPGMTVKQIREFKKKKKLNSGGVFDVATSQPEIEVKEILYGSFKDDIFIADLLGRCKKFAESTNMDMINPVISGKRLSFEDKKGNT